MKKRNVVLLVLICFIIMVLASFIGFRESKKNNSVVPDSGNKINNNGNSSNTNNDSNGLSLFRGEPSIDFYINDSYGKALASVKVPKDLQISTFSLFSELKNDNTKYLSNKTADNYLTLDEKSKSAYDSLYFRNFILQLRPRVDYELDWWSGNIKNNKVKYLKNNICYYYEQSYEDQTAIIFLYLLKDSKGEERVLWVKYDTNGRNEEKSLKYVDVIYNFIKIL